MSESNKEKDSTINARGLALTTFLLGHSSVSIPTHPPSPSYSLRFKPTTSMSNNDPKAGPASPIDEDAPGPPISVADSGDTGDGGKLKMIVQLVKKCLGVKDIAAMFVCLSFWFWCCSSMTFWLAYFNDAQASFVTCFTSGTYT